MKPLITVGIPTYNGSKYISETIDSILIQMEFVPEGFVEILISDNCSDDDTAKIIAGYCKKYPDIFSYYKNVENVGFDKNLNLIFERAQGKYVWLLSDDDVLISDALKTITELLKKDFDYIHLNWSECNQKLKVNNHKALKLLKNETFFDFNLFLTKVKTSPIFISSNIFKKSSWGKDANEFIGTGWLHYAKLFNISKRPSKILVVSNPTVKYRWSEGGWKTNHLFNIKLTLTLFDLINFYKDYISPKVLQECIDITLSELHFEICASRLSKEIIPADILDKLKKNLIPFWRFQFFYLKLLKIPLPVVRVFYWGCKAQRKIFSILH